MNKEDIYKMVRESDLGFLLGDNWMMHHEFEYFAALVASAEREACAEICKKHADFYARLEPSPIAQSAWAACVDNRDTIRAKGQA